MPKHYISPEQTEELSVGWGQQRGGVRARSSRTRTSGERREKTFPRQADSMSKCSNTNERQIQVFLKKGMWCGVV